MKYILISIIYIYKKNKFWSDLAPNIYIVSYNRKEYNKQKEKLDKYLGRKL